MTERTAAAESEESSQPLPAATVFRPGGSKGWVAPNVPGVVSVANNRQGDNPGHVAGKYQFKEKDGTWETRNIVWNQTQNHNTGGDDFSLKNTGTVILTVNP